MPRKDILESVYWRERGSHHVSIEPHSPLRKPSLLPCRSLLPPLLTQMPFCLSRARAWVLA